MLNHRKSLILCDFLKTSQKSVFLEKKGLRVVGDNLRTHFTGGAEAHNGTPDGADDRVERHERLQRMVRKHRGN